MNDTGSIAVDSLDRDSFVPLYHQLYETLRQQIDTGQWQPGSQLPSEAELAVTYSISQITIRKALTMLVDAGVIYRQKGKGTFVAQQPITSNLGQLISTEEDLQQRGIAYRVELLELMLAPVSKGTAAMLQIEIGEELACITRLFLVENEPFCIEGSYLVHRYCADVLGQVSATTQLTTLLANEYGLLAGKSEQTIRARRAGTEHASVLRIAPDDPLLAVERIVYSNRNVPFMLARVFYRGDRYALRLGIS